MVIRWCFYLHHGSQRLDGVTHIVFDLLYWMLKVSHFQLIIFQHPGGEEVLLEQAGEHFFFVSCIFLWSSPSHFTLMLPFPILECVNCMLPHVDVCDF